MRISEEEFEDLYEELCVAIRTLNDAVVRSRLKLEQEILYGRATGHDPTGIIYASERKREAMVEENAVITSADIRFDRGALLTAWVFIDTGGGGTCGFGGYLFGHEGTAAESPFGVNFIRRVLEVAGVSEWSELPGRPIRVRWKNRGLAGDSIKEIGHFIKRDWFNPKDIMTEKGVFGAKVGEE